MWRQRMAGPLPVGGPLGARWGPVGPVARWGPVGGPLGARWARWPLPVGPVGPVGPVRGLAPVGVLPGSRGGPD